MIRQAGLCGVVVVAAGAVGSACRGPRAPGLTPNEAGAAMTSAPRSACADGRLSPLIEDRDVYRSSNLDVWTVNITAPDTKALADVQRNVDGARVEVVFQEGDFGSDATEPNAVMELRGHSTRLTIQKSFHISLTAPGQTWRGYRKINLNKHPYDLTRVRNKLAFDTFATVPDFTSLRTQFVHLYINDRDYGLFTQIEALGDRFLGDHGLDPHGTLWKAINFSWQPIDAETAANPTELAAVVEDHNNGDLARLMRTIADVNDGEQDINDVIQRHFERGNFITWLAINVLTGNFDTVTQNFYLYGPRGCQGWYFLPWDYDGALEFYQQRGEASLPRHRAGLANWWSVPLIRRFLKDPRNLRDLDQRITELAQDAMSDGALHERARSYYGVVGPFVTRLPDMNYLPTSGVAAAGDRIAQWEDEYARLEGVIDRRVADYRYTLARPMPVRLYLPAPGPSPRDAYTFTWSRSFLLQGRDWSYDFEVSRTFAFAPGDLIVRAPGLRQAIAMATVPPGTYYWRVVARSDNQPDENWMTPLGVGYGKFEVTPGSVRRARPLH